LSSRGQHAGCARIDRQIGSGFMSGRSIQNSDRINEVVKFATLAVNTTHFGEVILVTP